MLTEADYKKKYPNMIDWKCDARRFDNDKQLYYYPYRLLDPALGDNTYLERFEKKNGPSVRAYRSCHAAAERNRVHPVTPISFGTEAECLAAIEELRKHPETPLGQWKTRKICGECKMFRRDKGAGRVEVQGMDCPVHIGTCAAAGKRVTHISVIRDCPVNEDVAGILEA